MVERSTDNGVIFECKGVSKLDVMPLAEQPVLATLSVNETSRTVGCSMLAENGNCQAVSPINQRACPYLLPKTILSTQMVVEVPNESLQTTMAKKGLAKFRILAQSLEAEIVAGRLSGKLGTQAKLSKEYKISIRTMRKTLAILRAKGHIINTEDGICVNETDSGRVSVGNFLDTKLASSTSKSRNPSTIKLINLVSVNNSVVEINVDGLPSRLIDIVRVDDLDRQHTSGRRCTLQTEFDYGGEIVDSFDKDDFALQQACDTLTRDESALHALIFQSWGGGLREQYNKMVKGEAGLDLSQSE